MGKINLVIWALSSTGWQEEGVSKEVREEQMTFKPAENASRQKDVKGGPRRRNSMSKGMGVRDHRIKVRNYWQFCIEFKASNLNFIVKAVGRSPAGSNMASLCTRIVTMVGRMDLKRCRTEVVEELGDYCNNSSGR